VDKVHEVRARTCRCPSTGARTQDGSQRRIASRGHERGQERGVPRQSLTRPVLSAKNQFRQGCATPSSPGRGRPGQRRCIAAAGRSHVARPRRHAPDLEQPGVARPQPTRSTREPAAAAGAAGAEKRGQQRCRRARPASAVGGVAAAAQNGG